MVAGADHLQPLARRHVAAARSPADAVLHPQVEAGGLLHHPDVRQRPRPPDQGLLDLVAGGVAVGMEDPPDGVGAFAGEPQSAALPVEVGAPLHELPDAFRPLLHQVLEGVLPAEVVPGAHAVLKMLEGGVLLLDGGGDPALGEVGVRSEQLALGHHQDPERGRQPDGRAQPGDAGTQDQDVRCHPLHGAILL